MIKIESIQTFIKKMGSSKFKVIDIANQKEFKSDPFFLHDYIKFYFSDIIEGLLVTFYHPFKMQFPDCYTFYHVRNGGIRMEGRKLFECAIKQKENFEFECDFMPSNGIWKGVYGRNLSSYELFLWGENNYDPETFYIGNDNEYTILAKYNYIYGKKEYNCHKKFSNVYFRFR